MIGDCARVRNCPLGMKLMVSFKDEQFEELDLSKVNVRVRGVLRKMRVVTVEQLLGLDEGDFLALKNCGPKTTAKIMMLQAEYGKDITSQNEQETIDEAGAGGIVYMGRLIGVVIAANAVVEGAKKQNRYYLRVSKRRFNALRQALEALRKRL